MLVLGIDTSSSTCSLALYDGKKVLSDWSVDNGLTHSEKLMPQLEMLLVAAGVDKKDIGGLAVCIGPGSFTGLRIGLASAKSMCYAWSVPVAGVPLPVSLAWNAPLPGVLLSPLIDAQKGEVYQSLYEWRREADAAVNLHEIAPVAIRPYAEALAVLADSGRQCVVLGDVLDGALPANVDVLPPHVGKPRAVSVAIAAYARLSTGESDDLFTLQPLYLKRSEAEILWEKRQKKSP